ncbi:hypothetical protein ACVME8_009629 [Bradyrhizobium diazoefficiens]
MSDLRDLLIRGSEKVIGHYRLLLASAKTEAERQLYRSLDRARAAATGRLARRIPRSVRYI